MVTTEQIAKYYQDRTNYRGAPFDQNFNYDLDAWLNRFEIPVTMMETDLVLEIIQHPKFSRLIQNVYLPAHGEDSISARSFYPIIDHPYAPEVGYKKTKEQWLAMIRRIAQYKKVTLTIPFLKNIDLIKEYINHGVSEIMVSEYWPGLDEIKGKIKISRSILRHHDSDQPVDERFDGVVIPYRKAMDLSWLEENSKKFELIAIVNHVCQVDCPAKKHFEKYYAEISEQQKSGLPISYHRAPRSPACYKYTTTSSSMLPRGILLKLSKYISRYKLTERLSHPFFYLNYLNYYAYNEKLFLDKNSPLKLMGEGIIEMMQDREDHYRGSNMETLNCKFHCDTCTKKCFSKTDWSKEQSFHSKSGIV